MCWKVLEGAGRWEGAGSVLEVCWKRSRVAAAWGDLRTPVARTELVDARLTTSRMDDASLKAPSPICFCFANDTILRRSAIQMACCRMR